MLIPIPNNCFKEINKEKEVNQTYTYTFEEKKNFYELGLSKHCSILRNCKYITNNLTQIINTDKDLMI